MTFKTTFSVCAFTIVTVFLLYHGLFNSNKQFDDKILRCGFEVHFAHQTKALQDFYNTVFYMRKIGRDTLLPCQKGILLNIASLSGLYDDLVRKFNIEYIFTYHLCLETEMMSLQLLPSCPSMR